MTAAARAPRHRLVLLACALCLTDCTVGPDFERPTPAAQNAFPDQALGKAGPADAQQTAALAAQARGDWWRLLESPKLDDVVRQSLAQNWTLASRKAAIVQAGRELAGVKGENYPTLNAVSEVGQTRIGATVFGVDALNFPIFSAYGVGLAAGYEPDVFGGRRRRIEGAAANVEEQIDEWEATGVTLVTNVALQAVQFAEARREVALQQDIVASDQQTVDLVSSAHRVGAAPNADVVQSQAQLEHDRAQIPALRQRLELAKDALATLAGRSPADWTPPDFELADFTLPEALPSVAPSQLAHQRPDILAAEAHLHSASAAIGVATADLYPQFDLTAVVSREGLLGGPAETAWTLLGGATAPIFNGGRLRAAKAAAEAAYRESFADYQQVVITALGQIADALNALANDADTLAAQERAQASASESLRLARQGYGAGSADLTRVLDSQRLLDEAQRGVVQAQAARLADTVRLFSALGLQLPPGRDRAATDRRDAPITPPQASGALDDRRPRPS
jgi:NodT family efflux transporter outer membrane factor (OMF) lipoprotein